MPTLQYVAPTDEQKSISDTAISFLKQFPSKQEKVINKLF